MHKGRIIPKGIKYALAAAILIYIILCFSMEVNERESIQKGECRIYYSVNIDGMGGLGHSILILEDEEGNGLAVSYNGMQTDLRQALLGKSGVGRMTLGELDERQLQEFIDTGNLNLEGDQLQDNYDLTVYNNITKIDYYRIIENTAVYLETGRAYENLYEQFASEQNPEQKENYRNQLLEMGEDITLPLYNLYHNNCDDVTRLLIAAVDEEMSAYNRNSSRLTPNGNVKGFVKSSKTWGVRKLGSDSMKEIILSFLMIF